MKHPLLWMVVAALAGCPQAPAPTTSTTTPAPAVRPPPATPTTLVFGGAPARWRVDIVVVDERQRVRLATLGPALAAIAAEVERQHDPERSESELGRFNRTPSRRPQPVDPVTLGVVTECLELGRLTDGAFDVTAAPIRSLFSSADAPSAEALAAARARAGLARVGVVGGMLRKNVVDLVVDVRPVGDGVMARAMVAALAERGVETRFRVEVGGVVVADGVGLDGPWKDLDGADLPTARVVVARRRATGTVVDPRTAGPVTHDVVGCDIVGRGVDPVPVSALAETCLVVGEDGMARIAPRVADVEVRVVRRGSGG